MKITIEQGPIHLPWHPRTDGVHLSSIIRCIAGETGILKLELIEDWSLISNFREITDRVALLRISIGLAWEAYYIPLLPDVADHPDEMHVDGIYMNMDGNSITVFICPVTRKNGLLDVVHEIKATYKSTKTVGVTEEQVKKNIKKNWMWLCQLMAYCRAKKTLHGWLHVLFLCNDYKFPMIPELLIYKFEFTQEELDENWDIVRDYRDERLYGAEGEAV